MSINIFSDNPGVVSGLCDTARLYHPTTDRLLELPDEIPHSLFTCCSNKFSVKRFELVAAGNKLQSILAS